MVVPTLIKEAERRAEIQRALDENRHYVDKILEARYAYWSALLTVNGFILALFSIQAINEGQRPWLTLALIGCAATSIVLLLINFAVLHSEYGSIGPIGVTKPLPPEDVREVQIRRGRRRRRSSTFRLHSTEILLVGQIVLIGFLVWPQPRLPENISSPPLEIVLPDSTIIPADSLVSDSLTR